MSDFLTEFHKKREARLAADRTFTLAGETLTHRPSVAPQIGLKLEAARHKVSVELLEISQRAKEINGSVPDEFVRLISGQTTDVEMLQISDEVIVACLEPDSHEAWGRLRDENAAYPLSVADVMEIADFLIERVTQIPTVAPAGSSDGRTETVKPSKGTSSSAGKTRRR